MSNKAYEKWLNQREDTIKEQVAESANLSNFDFEDGTYIGLFSENKIQQDKNENFGAKIGLTILEGERAGDTYTNWNNLDREDGFKWYGLHLKNAGADIEPETVFKALKENPEDVCGLVEAKTVVKFSLKTKKYTKDGVEKEAQNLTIQKVLPDFDIPDGIEDLKKLRSERKKEREAEQGKGADNKGKKEEEPKEVELSVGMTIEFNKKIGKNIVELEGVVTAIDEKKNLIKVKADDDEFEISGEDITNIKEEGTV